jgi:hypothetical protein
MAAAHWVSAQTPRITIAKTINIWSISNLVAVTAALEPSAGVRSGQSRMIARNGFNGERLFDAVKSGRAKLGDRFNVFELGPSSQNTNQSTSNASIPIAKAQNVSNTGTTSICTKASLPLQWPV